MKLIISLNYSMMDTRILLKLVKLSGEKLSLSSWWSILAEKLSVYKRIDLVAVVDTDARRAMSPNNSGIPLRSCLTFFLLCLDPEVHWFAYYGIMREECEGISCSSQLGEAIVAASRLT